MRNEHVVGTPTAVGERFGRLLVLSPAQGVKHVWLCVCECGERVPIRDYNLQSGKTQDCGLCTPGRNMVAMKYSKRPAYARYLNDSSTLAND